MAREDEEFKPSMTLTNHSNHPSSHPLEALDGPSQQFASVTGTPEILLTGEGE
jgi:hypothetical protein